MKELEIKRHRHAAIIKSGKATIEMSKNGYKQIRIRSIAYRAFTIPTNGNLAKCHALPVGYRLDAHRQCDLWAEIIEHISAFGTNKQREAFGLREVTK